jgi:Transposase IS4
MACCWVYLIAPLQTDIQLSQFNRPGDFPDEQWFEKVNPMANSFRKATTPSLYSLPQDLCVDETLVQFSGRTKHIIQTKSKAAGEEYKIYCCPNGYLIDFRFTSPATKKKVAEIDKWSEFTKSEAAVLDLVTKAQARFPRTTPYSTRP